MPISDPKLMGRCTSVLSGNEVRITVRSNPGVEEKQYQCLNRIGLFEALSKVFTNKFARVEHNACAHQGSDVCEYVISWERTSSLFWRQVRNYTGLAAIIFCFVSFFIFRFDAWLVMQLGSIALNAFIWIRSEQVEKVELKNAIKNQGNDAKKIIDEANILYNSAWMIQEIGQVASNFLSINRLTSAVAKIVEKRLDFDRGMIMLANRDKTRLVYSTGYGYDSSQEKQLQNTEFHLDKPDSKGFFVMAFREKKPFLINDIRETEEEISQRSIQLAREMGVKSLVCTPITYEGESLGILAVDNVKSGRSLTRSDMGLLTGVASQIATCIINARSYQKLQESEKKYRELVENANSIIMRMDTEGRIAFFNEFAQDFFGYSEDEIIGKNIIGTIMPQSELKKQELDELIRTIREEPGRQIVREDRSLVKDRGESWIAWTYRPIFDESGGFNQILCIGNDISELKRASAEKENLENQLQQAQKMEAIGTLAGGIAHDFNNILSGIIGYTELSLLKSSRDSEVRPKMEEVLKAGNRAKDLVSQILTFSRQSEEEKKPVQIHLIIKEALKLLRASLPSTVEINQNIETHLGSVMGSATQIHQVLMNLGTNAQHAMIDDGGVLEVSLSAVEPDSKELRKYPDSKELRKYPDLGPAPYLRLTVKDTGKGMDRETKERILEPCFTTKEKGVGTGLGLSVVHGIVKKHGGAVRVESEKGKGTAFHVFLPVIRAELETATPKQVTERVQKGTERILFVDDEASLVELGREILTSLGYETECKVSATEALETFSREPDKFDLVITDMTMPAMTGDRLAKKMMAIRPDIPIILCTGYHERMTEQVSKEMGIKEFIMKPLAINNVAPTVRAILDNN